MCHCVSMNTGVIVRVRECAYKSEFECQYGYSISGSVSLSVGVNEG